MTTRSWLWLFGLLAAAVPPVLPGLSISHVGLAAPAGADVVHVPEARVGDVAIYQRAAPEGADAPAIRFEWLDRMATRDRWGLEHDAAVLRLTTSESQEDLPPLEGAGFDEAFAGVAYDPIWRLRLGNASHARTTLDLGLPVAGLRSSDATRLNTTVYGEGPDVLSCFAHHGLQGRVVAPGDEVPLATLCPAVARLPVPARAQPARSAAFQGRSAVELAYDILAPGGAAEDLALPGQGQLRVVLADGYPVLVQAEASGEVPGGAWRFTLAEFLPGEGEPVAAWLGGGAVEPRSRPGARFAPLGPEGPRDGGSGLRYALEDALANVRGDMTLLAFRAWQQRHPQAFVVAADYSAWQDLGQELPAHAHAAWEVTFGAPRSGDDFNVFVVRSKMTYALALERASGRPLGAVTNTEVGEDVRELVAERPRGQQVLDVASALRAWEAQVPEPFRGQPVTRLAYAAPGPGQAASYWVEHRALMPHESFDFEESGVLLDGSTGAAREMAHFAEWSSTTGVSVGRPLRAHEAAGAEPAPPRVGSAEAVVLTAAAAAVTAVLARGGYLTVLYSRLRRSELLDHPVRRRVYDLILARPGIHLKGVAAALGLGTGAAVYHLRVLERGSLVTHVSLPNYRRYYLSGSVPHGALRSVAELESPGARAVYEAARAQPGMTLTELARRARMNLPTAHRTVERLRGAGLLEKRTEGRLVRITPREIGRN